MEIKEKIKKNLKKVKVAGLALAALTSSVLTMPAKAETSFYSFYRFSQPQLNQDFLNNLGDDYINNIKDWNLRPAQVPIPHATSLNSFGIGTDVGLEKILENINFLESCRENLYFTANFGICNFGSIYDQLYIFTDPDYGDYCDRLIREEKNELLKYSCGIKFKKNLSDKFRLDASVLADLYNLNGSANLTRTRGTLSNPTSYTQWRNANYNGSSFGLSAGLDLSMMLNRHFSVGLGIGYNSANINTKGDEIRTSTSSPNPIKKDYDPEFNLNSINADLVASYRF